jgi:hypothetical protein
MTREERFLEPWNAARAAIPNATRELERVTTGAEQGARVAHIEQLVNSYVQEYSVSLVDAARRNDPLATSVAATDEGKRRVDAIRAEFDGFIATQTALATKRQDESRFELRRGTVAASVGLGASVLLIAFFGVYLTRAIVLPVRLASTMAGRLAGGDLERSFNTMATSLGQSREELRLLLDGPGLVDVRDRRVEAPSCVARAPRRSALRAASTGRAPRPTSARAVSSPM